MKKYWSERQSEIAPRRREGRVREHPRPDSFGRSATAGAAAMAGALGVGMAVLSKKGSPAIRALMGIGGAVIGGYGVSRLYKDDPAVATLGLATAGAAAAAAYVLIYKQGGVGFKALRDFASKHNAKSVIDSTQNALADARKLFPGISPLLSTEGAALGAALITLPAAHSIMVKHFAAEKRRNTDHGEVGFMAAWQDNKAGHKGFRQQRGPLFGNNYSGIAAVNFQGSVNSYYNSAAIFEGV